MTGAATIVGFDTSTAATSVCLLRADGEAFEVVPDPAALGLAPAHARELMPEIDAVMRRAGVGFEDLDAVAVGVGPGTFTGVRIGVATARAIAAARGIPVHAVSSLRALARAVPDRAVLALIDAKRGELFAGLYSGDAELVAPFVAAPDEVVARIAQLPANALAIGDGSLRFRGALEAASVPVAAGDSVLHVVRALNVCRLAAVTPAMRPQGVLPTYLRAPDAQPKT